MTANRLQMYVFSFILSGLMFWLKNFFFLLWCFCFALFMLCRKLLSHIWSSFESFISFFFFVRLKNEKKYKMPHATNIKMHKHIWDRELWVLHIYDWKIIQFSNGGKIFVTRTFQDLFAVASIWQNSRKTFFPSFLQSWFWYFFFFHHRHWMKRRKAVK